MSLTSQLEKLKALLSSDDLLVFETLSDKLRLAKGDLSQLSSEERELIRTMETKYNDKINHAVSQSSTEVVPDEFPMLKTEFASYVKDMLLRELGAEFNTLQLAVDYAYQTKWIPAELKNRDVCETLFERFFADIEQANQWREQFSDTNDALTDKSMSVGLAWFIYVYQLKQWVDHYNG